MEKNKLPFIFTNDKEVADDLEKRGFKFCNATGNGYLFFNDLELPMNFSSGKNIAYTDKLFI